MTNDDLKRLYKQNANPQNKDDFARYDSNGNITIGNAVNPKDAVNYETLVKYAGGPGSDLNYKGLWVANDEIKQYDIVYVDNDKTRIFYMCIKDINNSDVSPNLDEEHYVEYLEVPLSTGGIETLVGTEEKPINVVTDLESNKYYIISGNITAINNNSKAMLVYKQQSTVLYTYNTNGATYATVFILDPTGTSVLDRENSYNIEVNGGNTAIHAFRTTSIFAPTTGGTQGQILQSNGNAEPTWVDASSGGGAKLYQHFISLGIRYKLVLITNEADIFTYTSLNEYLLNNGLTDTYHCVPVTGTKYYVGNAIITATGIFGTDTGIEYFGHTYSFNFETKTVSLQQQYWDNVGDNEVIDTVIEL